MTKVRFGDKEFDLEKIVICPLSGRPLLRPDAGGEEFLTAHKVLFSELGVPEKKRTEPVSPDEIVFVDAGVLR